MRKSADSPLLSFVPEIGKKLMLALTTQADRKTFFSTLSRLLQERFEFDRLCINLYDQQGEMLTYFTAAEGKYVSTLSPVRPAETSSTVAGHVIATRKPVVITDFAQYFSESSIHPIAEAGLVATMAFPLMLANEIIATLHCSFSHTPDNIYAITAFLLELSPVVATCLGAILSLEHLRYNEKHLLVQSLSLSAPDENIVCHSKRMRDVMRQVDAVAKLDIPVLVLGETGTGKTLIAQAIHRRSLRKDAHFVHVNCPSMASSLFESEFFGHAKGAFTGAANKRIGRFEVAHGGTIFLDEVAELSPEMQSKLLQVLDNASFERVGESISVAVDVRVVAATNVKLNEALVAGRLRADFFYRLSLCTIELPPLRERREDIPPLITSFSAQMTQKMDLPFVKFTASLLAPLQHYDWPGNIRELRNVISKIIVYNSIHRQVGAENVQAILEESRALLSCATVGKALAPCEENVQAAPPAAPVAATTLADMERQHILTILERTGGVIAGPAGAAALLGIPRTTLQHRMHKLGITPHSSSPRA